MSWRRGTIFFTYKESTFVFSFGEERWTTESAYRTPIFSVSLPSCSIFAFPMGITKSSPCASSVMGKGTPYSNSFSRNTTGLGSRIDALMSPFASSLDQGATTLRAGTEEYHAAKH